MLQTLPDSPIPVDYIKNAVKAVEPYDTDGSIAKAIIAGAGSSNIFKKLDAVLNWKSDLSDKEEELAHRRAAILDLDHLVPGFASMEEVLPAK
jgi:hypothetical protein